MPDKPSILRHREIRDVFNYLTSGRGQSSSWTIEFIRRNYFIMDPWQACKRADQQPVDPDKASVIYKVVMRNEYFDI